MGRIVLCAMVGLLFLSQPAFCLDSIEFLSGYLEGDLKEKGNYEAIPLMVCFNFDAEPFIEEKTGITIAGDLNFSVEPFINPVISPDANIEVGVNFLTKYTLPFRGNLKPYLKGGLGVLYMSQHTREQSTQYNFLSQMGVGASYFINENTALNFEYRFRHLSNASFKSPNAGIDTDMFLGGVAFYF